LEPPPGLSAAVASLAAMAVMFGLYVAVIATGLVVYIAVGVLGY
jgi:hypothetical protein